MSLTIFHAFSFSMFSHDSLSTGVVAANSSIEITQLVEHIMPRDVLSCCLQSAVELILVLFCHIIDWGIGHQDSQFDIARVHPDVQRRSLMGFHCSSACACFLMMMRATPSSWLSSFLPDQMNTSHVLSFCLPVCVHLASVTARRFRLYRFISLTVCASFPVWYKVCTFQHPTCIWCFGIRRSTVGLGTSFWLWPPSFISPVAWSVSLPLPSEVFSLVFVSIVERFYKVGLLAPRPTLLLSHPGLGPAMAEFMMVNIPVKFHDCGSHTC
jgi:hypothetical protein